VSSSLCTEVSQAVDSYNKLSLEEKRQKYACGSNFLELGDVTTYYDWYRIHQIQRSDDTNISVDIVLNRKIGFTTADICTLEIDAIVNAANTALSSGGGVCGAIHRAAGPMLAKECKLVGGCTTGEAKITNGHNLPANYVIHAVGPRRENPPDLSNAYKSSLDLCIMHGLRTIAFSTISTGTYGYPCHAASGVVLETLRTWLTTDKNYEHIDRIIFCLFTEEDVLAYNSWLPHFFPVGPDWEPAPVDPASADPASADPASAE
jgi:O-acetyl-ADP-ribose deacetylase (regulator of RNase III)